MAGAGAEPEETTGGVEAVRVGAVDGVVIREAWGRGAEAWGGSAGNEGEKSQTVLYCRDGALIGGGRSRWVRRARLPNTDGDSF